MAFWLVKSEPSDYSIAEFARDKVTIWDGVRNYQARNFLRQMAVGESVLFYHSSCDEVGIVGLAEVAAVAEIDPTQFKKDHPGYDPKSKRENPLWYAPKLRLKEKFSKIISLPTLRSTAGVEKMELLRKGSRLSVQQVRPHEFQTIIKLSSS